METDGRDREHDGEGSSNVVRLPRDWLGPREELVPFGPQAWRAESPSGQEADVLELTPRPDPSDTDCTRVDFWGGDLNAIPRPVLAPSPPEAPSPSLPPAEGVRRQRPTAASRSRARRSLVAAAAVALGGGAWGIALNNSTDLRRASQSAVVGADATVADLPARLAAPSPKFSRPQVVRVSRPPHAAPRVHHAVATPSGTVTFVRASSPAPVTSSRVSSETTSVTSHPAATTAPETTRPTTATAASTHATKAGPVGRGAPFGPGQLG